MFQYLVIQSHIFRKLFQNCLIKHLFFLPTVFRRTIISSKQCLKTLYIHDFFFFFFLYWVISLWFPNLFQMSINTSISLTVGPLVIFAILYRTSFRHALLHRIHHSWHLVILKYRSLPYNHTVLDPLDHRAMVRNIFFILAISAVLLL